MTKTKNRSREKRFLETLDHCRNGELDSLAALLSKDSKLVNLQDNDGNSLLHIVCYLGRQDMLLMLLFKGVEVNTCNNKGITPLMVALEYNQVLCANVLIVEHGADVKQCSNTSDQTCLHIACIYDCTECINNL